MKGHYIIFSSKEGGKEFSLMRANVLTKDGVVQGRLEHDPHIRPTAVECSLEDVVLDLGKTPKPGSVYGKDLSFLYRKTLDIPHLGDVHLFTSVPREVGQEFVSQAKGLYKTLKEMKLGFLLHSGIVWQVVSRHTAGKYSGMYRSGKTDKDGNVTSPPRITITLDEETLKTSSVDTYAYVLAHELGHALHFQSVKQIPELDAAWLDMYTNTVTPVKIPQSEVVSMRDELITSGATFSGFKSTLEEERTEAFKIIVSEIRRTSRLSLRELDTLTQTESSSDHVKRVWPNSSVYMSKLSPLITQYSLKNYHELFAESFAFHVLGKKLPKQLTSLLRRTLTLVT
jgi:hypothetical protein